MTGTHEIEASEPTRPTRVVAAVACFGALLLIGVGNLGLGGLAIAIGVVALVVEHDSPLRHSRIGPRSIGLLLFWTVAAIGVALLVAMAAGDPYDDLPVGVGAAAGAITVIGIMVMAERLGIGASDRGSWALGGALLSASLYGIAAAAGV